MASRSLPTVRIHPRIVPAFFIYLLCCFSCGKEDRVNETDQLLYTMAKQSAGFTWYKNSESLLNRSSGSGHSQPYLRTRFNSIAAAILGADGKVTAGSNFPVNSLIVKELYDASESLSLYAILYKQPDHPMADNKGWVWGYINAGGRVVEPAANRGSACSSCHSQEGNIDYSLMNKFFP
jgi:hypothetical protein